MEVQTNENKKPTCIFQYRRQAFQAVILVVGNLDYHKNKETCSSLKDTFPDAYYILIDKYRRQNLQVNYAGYYHVVLDIDVDVPSLYTLHPSCVLTQKGLQYIYNTFFKQFDTDLIIKVDSGTQIPPSFTLETIDTKQYNFFPVYGDVLDNMVLDPALFTIPVVELEAFITTLSTVMSKCSNTALCVESMYRQLIKPDKIKLQFR